MVTSNALHALAERARSIDINTLQTEEAAKTSLVLPFIQALGYDIFDPTEVVPEFTADHGLKQGEKVDYAVISAGKPAFIFECKKANDTLDINRASQLSRYFTQTDARIAILTGGVLYKFYSDLIEPNKMDREPFLEFDIRALDNRMVAEIEPFSKQRFDIEKIRSAASEMSHIKGIKEELSKLHTQPGEGFVRAMAEACNYPGPGTRLTQERLETFTRLVRRAFQGFVNDRINETLASAMARQNVPESDSSEPGDVADETDRSEGGIITTVEEQEAYEMVKSIVSGIVDPERVNIRDTQSYCAVVLDGNSRQTICRFRFGPRVKYLCFGPATGEEQHLLASLDDIANHSDQLQETVRRFLQR